MKKTIILLGVLFCTALSFAQLESQKENKKKIRMSGDDRCMVDFFHTNWAQQPDSSIQIEAQSRGMSASIMYDYPLGKSNFAVAAGIGFTTHNVFMNASVSYDTLSDGLLFSKLEQFADGYTYDMNKVSTNYFDIPIELRWRGAPDNRGRRWKVMAGFRFGFRFDAHTKTIDNTGKHYKFEFHSTFNDFSYGVSLRFGWHRFMAYGYYGLSGIFKPDRGVHLTPWSVGLTYSLL